ncbi:hypothetical protein NF701_05100 [Sphingomonadaceae bacterium OTU29THOMA1]|nr:hypothetical protein NF701_05100 [Sphingomonadaceae bacterium OTU29THOMA1]
MLPGVTLTMSLRALEVIRDGDARVLLAADKPASAAAHTAIIDNAIDATLTLAAAVKAAAAGDQEAARRVAEDLRLDELEVR